MVGRQEHKLERLYLEYLDKQSIAKTMRENLASDIICGYHIGNVVKQMVNIESYEETVVAKARKEYENYRQLVAPELNYNKWEHEIIESIRRSYELLCSR